MRLGSSVVSTELCGESRVLLSLCTECMFTAYGYPVTYHGDQSDMPCWTLYFHCQNQLTNTSELFSVLPVTIVGKRP